MRPEKEYIDYSKENILFKDLKTRFPLLELILSNKRGESTKNLGKGYKMKFDKYNDYQVLSCCYHRDSITTIVVLYDPSRDPRPETLSDEECKAHFLSFICNYCKSKVYCSSDCGLRKKAKALSDRQWRDLARKYNDNIAALIKSIKRRRVKYE